MPTIPDLRGPDAVAVRASVAVVAQVTAADLGRPTPCAAWDLRALLAHMTVQHLGFAAAAEGNGASPDIWQPVVSVDPVGDYVKAADRAIQAFRNAFDGDVLDRPFDLGELGMTIPGRMAISFHFIDYVVHGWDVAAALGQTYDLPDDILRAAVPVAEAVPAGKRRLAPSASFGPPLAESAESADDGSLNRILRWLGRSPDFGK